MLPYRLEMHELNNPDTLEIINDLLKEGRESKWALNSALMEVQRRVIG